MFILSEINKLNLPTDMQLDKKDTLLLLGTLQISPFDCSGGSHPHSRPVPPGRLPPPRTHSPAPAPWRSCPAYNLRVVALDSRVPANQGLVTGRVIIKAANTKQN